MSSCKRYPKVVVTVSVASYQDDGCVYTLTLPDGSTRTIGEAEDDYHTLADIIDRRFEAPTPSPTTRQASEVALLLGYIWALEEQNAALEEQNAALERLVKIVSPSTYQRLLGTRKRK